jgi:FkbM family methyltransferase
MHLGLGRSRLHMPRESQMVAPRSRGRAVASSHLSPRIVPPCRQRPIIQRMPVADAVTRLRQKRSSIRAYVARRLCRRLPPFLAYRLHFTLFHDLVGQDMNFDEKILFGKARITGTFRAVEDAYFALHGTMNYCGMAAASVFVRPGDTVFEIGANRATETLPLAALVGPSGKVVAIEADPDTAAILSARTAGEHQVMVEVYAISDKRGVASWSRVDHAPGTSYLTTSSAGPQVNTTTIDEVASRFGRPSLIFMDIEGSEYAALRGGEHTITKVRPVIIAEVNSALLQRSGSSIRLLSSFMKNHGYIAMDLQKKDHPLIDLTSPPQMISTDWLFLPEERTPEVPYVRRTLKAARFMPRVLGLNPLDRDIT